MLRPAPVLVGLVAAQRLFELRRSRRNERILRARGASEIGAGHYPVMVALHAAWLLSTLIEGWRRRRVSAVPLMGLLVAHVLRRWAIASLGTQWTTRVLVDRSQPSVTAGPYRWMRHPNYVAVELEMICLPLALFAPWSAASGGLANAALLRHRIRIEEEARADGDTTAVPTHTRSSGSPSSSDAWRRT